MDRYEAYALLMLAAGLIMAGQWRVPSVAVIAACSGLLLWQQKDFIDNPSRDPPSAHANGAVRPRFCENSRGGK
jgi:hypothetical protein